MIRSTIKFTRGRRAGMPGRRIILPAHLMKRRRAHAIQTGEVLAAWNDLHAACFELFEALLEPKNPGIALGIWHSISSDKTQREIMMAVGKAALPSKSCALAHLTWLKNKSDVIAKFRNDPAHTPMTIEVSPLNGESVIKAKSEHVPDFSKASPKAITRLNKSPFSQSWRKIRGDLVALSNFAHMLSFSIHAPERFPLPRKPQLLTLPEPHPQKSRTRLGREKRPTQPQSSLE